MPSYRKYIEHGAPVLFATVALLLEGCSGDRVKVVSAVYGSGTTFADVSARVSELVGQPKIFTAQPQSLHADPTPGWNKVLVIAYDVGGHRHVFATSEGGEVSAKILRFAADQ